LQWRWKSQLKRSHQESEVAVETESYVETSSHEEVELAVEPENHDEMDLEAPKETEG
jgi:hypothetical protein